MVLTEKWPKKATAKKILEVIQEDPGISQMRLAEQVGLSYSSVRYAMKQMRTDGILDRVGPYKKGQWVIRK